MQSLPTALQALGAFAQFMLWKGVPNGKGGTNKFPVDPRTLQVANAHDPSIWLPQEKAVALHQATGLGVGFVFTKADPFFFLDIDKCYDETAKSWSPLALELLSRFDGAGVEVSQSGKGLHIFGTGTCPPHGCKNIALGLELYTEGRFVALTGTTTGGDAALDCGDRLPALVRDYFPQTATLAPSEWSYEPVPEWAGPEDDAQLIELMLGAKTSAASAFGGRASVRDLWEANEQALADTYPDTEGDRAWDGSSADMALCSHLAFYTGKDCERIERLFNLSGLVRDKWEERDDYRHRTILGAISLCQNVYGEKPKTDPMNATPVEPVAPMAAPHSSATPPAAPTAPQAPAVEVMGHDATVAMREGFQYLALDQQRRHFAGCVYIQDIHRVFTPEGCKLKPEQFKTTYGGYVFALDAMNDKVTKNAWEAFTESQGIKFPKAHRLCFRPDLPAGSVVPYEGLTGANSYVPIPIKRVKGDVSPFLDHLAKLLPVEHDRAILLAYMAACVQHPGVKFQWTPLMQGMEGNGKTLLATCLAEAIGHRYTHIQAAQDLGNQFNAWVQDNMLVVVEEVHVSDRREMLDALKPLITNARVGVQGKGVDQSTGDNCANFFMFSNHKDAILKTRTDRRFCVFYTAQQEPEDMEAAGMGGDYFTRFWDWARQDDGFAKITEFFHTYDIPAELNPARACHRAPATSSTAEAVALSIGGVEQEILEAIEEGRTGFAGGWISSMAFDRFLAERRNDKRVPQNKRKGVLRALGYEPHPGLPDGRANSVVALDGGKPRLYVRSGHHSMQLTTGREIVAAYVAAQAGQLGQAPTDASSVFQK